MKAIAFTAPGGPDVLQLVDFPDPEPGPGELLIRVHAAAVSPTDTVRRSRKRASVEDPQVVGMDAAGVIEAIGPDTETELAVGEQVMAFIRPSGTHGAYAQRVAVSAESVARIPANSTLAQAATLPMNGLTARLALDILNLPKGATLAVSGAAGTLGGYVIQLAKAEGLVVIADTSDEDFDLVEGFGADILKLRGTGFADAVRQKFPQGVDAVVDASVQLDEVVPAVKDGGTVITIRGDEGERERGVTLQPIWVADYDRRHDKLDELRQQVEDGILTLRVADVIPMDQAAEAHRRFEAGGVRGRLVLDLADPSED